MARLPSSQLSTSSESVRNILERALFEIPMNQRSYEWGKEQIENLWEDICLTIKSDQENEGHDSMGHFLGAIVVIGKERSLDQARWKIIDGQQRLTTLIVLAECLRHYVDMVGDIKLRKPMENALWNCKVSYEMGSTVPRLRLNREDNFFRGLLIDCDTKESKEAYYEANKNNKSEVQNNIWEAFNFYYQNIESYIESEGGEYDNKVRDLVDTYLDKLYMLQVRTENTWMAYRLFETLNDRGLELSKADLIKNVLLEHAEDAGDDILEDVNEAWSSIRSNYEDQSKRLLELPQILQFSYTYRHKKVKKEDIFDKVAGSLRTGKRDALELAREFERDSINWRAFLLGDMINWSDRVEDGHYAIIDPLWKSHCAPFILGVMDKFSDDIELLSQLFTLCEHYLFRQGMICRDSVSSLQDFFGKMAESIRLGDDINQIAHDFKVASPDQPFIESFKTASISNMKQGFYAIWKIENFMLSEMNFRPKSQSAAQHLEHIMPKRPDENWGGVENEEDFGSYVNRIGNLLVLQSNFNQHIKNKSIDYKMSNETEMDYEHSELKLAAEFIENFSDWSVEGEWTLKSIEIRQHYLAETYAEKVWALDVI